MQNGKVLHPSAVCSWLFCPDSCVAAGVQCLHAPADVRHAAAFPCTGLWPFVWSLIIMKALQAQNIMCGALAFICTTASCLDLVLAYAR